MQKNILKVSHFTPEKNLDSILKNGLVPSKTKEEDIEEGIYVWLEVVDGCENAVEARPTKHKGKLVLLEIKAQLELFHFRQGKMYTGYCFGRKNGRIWRAREAILISKINPENIQVMPQSYKPAL